MTLYNRREQHAVGQGFFHSGELFKDGKAVLRYVYDCGAMQKYSTARNARIDTYLNAVGAKSILHLLYISHVHADHLNGLPRLLDKNTGLRVETIILPMLSVADRLIGFARTAMHDAGSASKGFYRDFIIDPVAALSRFSPQQILFIEHRQSDGGAPFSGGPPPDGGHDQPIFGKDPRDTGTAWKFVGRGSPVRHNVSGAADGEVQPKVIVIPDTLAMMIEATTAQRDAWLLAPFVDPTVKSHVGDFLNALAKRLEMTRAKLNKWIHNTANRKNLIINNLGHLVGAYTDIERDLNVTSLCLYSGLTPSSSKFPRLVWSEFGPITYNAIDTSVGWLATGDAALAHNGRRSAFIKHYGQLLKEVLTLTLPHHGSDHNFDPTLLTCIDPKFCIASADRYKNWKHPGSHVVQSIASEGLFLQVVTSQLPSRVEEIVLIN